MPENRATKQLNIRFTEEELKELHDKAQEKGMTMKEMIKQALMEDSKIPDGEELLDQAELEEETEAKLTGELAEGETEATPGIASKPEYTWDQVSDATKQALKEGKRWLGFDMEPVAQALGRMHAEWHILSEADRLAILGTVKVLARDEGYSSKQIVEQLAYLVKPTGAKMHDLMQFYHRVRLVKKLDGRTDAQLGESYSPGKEEPDAK